MVRSGGGTFGCPAPKEDIQFAPYVLAFLWGELAGGLDGASGHNYSIR